MSGIGGRDNRKQFRGGRNLQNAGLICVSTLRVIVSKREYRVIRKPRVALPSYARAARVYQIFTAFVFMKRS